MDRFRSKLTPHCPEFHPRNQREPNRYSSSPAFSDALISSDLISEYEARFRNELKLKREKFLSQREQEQEQQGREQQQQPRRQRYQPGTSTLPHSPPCSSRRIKIPRMPTRQQQPEKMGHGPANQGVPPRIIAIARSHEIPESSIFMAPVIKTTEGVITLDEYVKRIQFASKEHLRRDRSDESYLDFIAEQKEKSQSRGSITRHARTEHNMPSGCLPEETIKEGRVVMLHNLPIENLTARELFTLCGCFGDVHRVKIMYNKRDTAFIQMSNYSDANAMIDFLQGMKYREKNLVLIRSRIKEIYLSYHKKNTFLTQDFTFSGQHRFGSKSAKSRKYISAPSAILHASNLPQNYDLIQFQKDLNHPYIQCVVPGHAQKQAFIICENKSNAMTVLMKKHLIKIGDKYVRISFTAFKPSSEVILESISNWNMFVEKENIISVAPFSEPASSELCNPFTSESPSTTKFRTFLDAPKLPQEAASSDRCSTTETERAFNEKCVQAREESKLQGLIQNASPPIDPDAIPSIFYINNIRDVEKQIKKSKYDI